MMSRVGGSVAMAIVIAAAALVPARPAMAQQADVIRGRVTSSQTGAPIDGAVVTATTLSGGVNRSTRTDNAGRYTITFPNGSGDYFITVRAIGYVPRRFELKRLSDEDILIGDVRVAVAASALDTVVTLGRRDRPARADSAPDIGGMDRLVNATNVAIDNLGNLAAMAASTPGLLFIPGVDGDPAGYSVFGLDQTQNSTTLNGMNSGATDLPRDGDYAVTVALSPYDVSLGRFSGGRTNVRVSSGSNFIKRTGSLLLDAPPFEWTDAAGRALGQQYSNTNVGGGASGPIAFDQAFYNFSFQLGRSSSDLRTLLNTDPLGLQTAGIAGDSVARLVDILRGQRIPATVGRVPDNKLADQGLVLGSFDFTPPTSTSGQSYNLTVNAGWNRLSPAVNLTSAVPASAFDNTRWNGAVQGHHTAYFGFGVLSETGIAVSELRRFASPYLNLPAGSVLVGSTFANGAGALKTVSFGGAPIDNSTTSRSLEASNELSWFSMDNKHRIKLTTDLRRDALSNEQGANTRGTFAFNSLADLEAGNAASFTRQLVPIATHENEIIGGLSLGDSYRPTYDLQLVYGLRADFNRFLDAPARNNAVVQSLAADNVVLPNRLAWSPRVGFSWTYGRAPEIGSFEGSARVPRAVLRGGVGIFQGLPSSALVSQTLANTGLASGAQSLMCVGAAVPTPAWGAYVDASQIPTTCADGSEGTPLTNQAPNVTLFARDYAAPRSIRANVQWTGAVLGNRIAATINAAYSRNQHQPGFVDANLDSTARFTLADESNRPVFVAPSSIVASTGAIAAGASRVAPAFNHVTVLQSNLTSTASQIQLLLVPTAISTRYSWGLAYTLNNVRDIATGFSSTVGNPFDATAARAAFDWRHQIQVNAGYNAFDVVRLNWFQTFVAGLPYTPSVTGDVNGDGYTTNDRAFVFDPARASDPGLAAAMSKLLTDGPPNVRSCLARQLGRLAGRNSCQAPWTSTANLRIDFNPARVRMPERTMLSFSIANPLAAADMLLHGEGHPHGWGQFALPDNQLLFVRGFDPATRRFVYQVNSRFGNTSPAVSALRNPVALTAMVRVDVGPTRERQALTRTLDLGRTTPGPKVTAAELRAVYGTAGLINPMAVILRSSDSLHLTGRQADSIATLNRWYLVRLDSIWSPVVRGYAALPDRYSQRAAYAQYVRAREGSVDLLIALAPRINGVLTSAQRRKLPALTAAHLDERYLAAVRAGTPNLSAPVFPPPAGTPGERAGGRGGGGGGGGGGAGHL